MAYLYVGATKTYSTIQAAIDAAADGDIIIVDPGTYNENLSSSKALSFRANTDDPLINPVYIHGPVAANETLDMVVSPVVPRSIYIEGFIFTKASTSWTRVVRVIGNSLTKVYFNRCKITAGANQYPIGTNDSILNTFEIHNCYLIKGYNHLVRMQWSSIPTNGIFKTELNTTYGCQDCVGSPSTNDYVTTTTSGYGPLYGEYNIPLEVGYFDGYVFQEGLPVERTVRIYNRDDGRQLNETTSSGNGYYYLTTTYSGAHCLICLDDAAGDSYNDLILGNVYPTTLSGT